MKLAVIGSKEFIDYEKLKSTLDKIEDISQIISGGAPGTDTLAKKYALENNIDFLEFPPDFSRYEKDAKHIRDKLIVENCDNIIAFYDGKCKGTKYTLNYGKKLKKSTIIIEIN